MRLKLDETDLYQRGLGFKMVSPIDLCKFDNYSSFGLCKDTSAHKARPSFQDDSIFCTVKSSLNGDNFS